VPTIGGGSSLLGGGGGVLGGGGGALGGGGGALGGGGILGGGGGTLGGGGLTVFGGGSGGGSGFASSSGGPGAGTTPGGASALLLQAESGGGRGGGFGGSSISSQDLRAAVAQLAGCLGQLSSLERNVLVLRLGLDGGPMRSRGAVGRALGLSRGRMLSLERRGLHNLRGAASSSGCAAGASLISVSTFDPTTIGAFARAPFGAPTQGGGNGSLQFGSGPARTAIATPIWGPGKGNSLPWTIAALATLGGLLLLAGAVFSGSLFPPLPAPVESRSEPARRRRPAVARSGRFDRTRRGPAPVRTGVRHRRSDDRE
jgi:Sigma-70, region 4